MNGHVNYRLHAAGREKAVVRFILANNASVFIGRNPFEQRYRSDA